MSFESRVPPELRSGLDVYRELGFTATDLRGETLRRLRSATAAAAVALNASRSSTDRVTTTDWDVPEHDGALRLRSYRPADASGTTLPCLYWIHGGGMILGSLDQDDVACGAFAEQAGIAVVSVDYRLAPEFPHPVPVEDCFAGLRWTVDHATALGIDPDRIAVGGASAGGGLAAATCLLARDRGGPALAGQLLAYPMLDDRNDTPSAREFTGIVSWSREHNRSGWSALLGEHAGGADTSPYAAPARAAELSGLPPAMIQTGELDVFRDEDITYATRLLRAGVPTELHVHPGAYHACDTFAPDAALSKRMMRERYAALGRLLHA